MNDQLKKFIQDNRDDFDHLEPSVDILSKIKRELKDLPKEEKGRMRLIINYKWLVAATILITASITYLFLKNDTLDQDILQQKVAKIETPVHGNAQKIVAQPEDILIMPTKESTKRKSRNKSTTENLLTVYADLVDSTSASTRLAAVLSIQKSNNISYDVIDKLAQTLNHDSNSNVRLAALNLMSKYAQDSYVNNVFMLSLSNQKDPLLQLGLMELLRQTDSPKLDDKLYALANDPNTLSEVKDQAYLILMNQNKL